MSDVLAAHEAARQAQRPSDAELKAVAGGDEPDVSGFVISTGDSLLCGFCGPQCGTSRTSGPARCKLIYSWSDKPGYRCPDAKLRARRWPASLERQKAARRSRAASTSTSPGAVDYHGGT